MTTATPQPNTAQKPGNASKPKCASCGWMKKLRATSKARAAKRAVLQVCAWVWARASQAPNHGSGFMSDILI